MGQRISCCLSDLSLSSLVTTSDALSLNAELCMCAREHRNTRVQVYTREWTNLVTSAPLFTFRCFFHETSPMPSSRIEYCASACHITFVTHLIHAHHSPHALRGSRIQADGRQLLSSKVQYKHPHANECTSLRTHMQALSRHLPTKTQ